MIIGCPGNDHGGLLRPGKTYLIFGKTSGWPTRAGLLASANASFVGEDAQDELGMGVAGGGDVNDDGFNDILISNNAKGRWPTDNFHKDEIYLILGN